MLLYDFLHELFVGVFGYFSNLLTSIVEGALNCLFGIGA